MPDIETNDEQYLEDEEVPCSKCGKPVEMDNNDSHPEPLCYGCSHGQDEIDGGM